MLSALQSQFAPVHCFTGQLAAGHPVGGISTSPPHQTSTEDATALCWVVSRQLLCVDFFTGQQAANLTIWQHLKPTIRHSTHLSQCRRMLRQLRSALQLEQTWIDPRT